MKVLSLFDGMACGMLAMMEAGVEIERYVAYEIDKYAVQTSSHNFPMIEHRGDVFQADFTEFSGFDFLIGGSPCTYWSIAQKNNRETEASGMGWELFSQYVRALHEANPKYFIYENNKSMSAAIRASIDDAFGFEAVCINSSLVSAQNRNRLYWVGVRNEDGTYSKVAVPLPDDLGIRLKDILENGSCWMDKSYTIDSNYHKTLGQQGFTLQSGRRKMVAEPINMTADGKAQCLRATCYKDGIRNMVGNTVDRKTCVAEPVCVNEEGKAHCLAGNRGGHCLAHDIKKSTYSYAAEPVGVGYRNRREEDGKLYRRFETHNEEKSNALTTVQTDSMVAEPLSCYAVPSEWDENGKPTKAISAADGKAHPVYEVKDGQITIKGKQYPIKLKDGFYIIRKLTVRECMRLQTVPEWYEFPVSDTQAYKMLGNGWTVKVISHIVREVLRSEASEEITDEPCEETRVEENEAAEVAEEKPSGAVYVSNQKLNEVQRGLAGFACMVCHKKMHRDQPHAIDCAWRGIDNEFCPDIIESLKEAMGE